MAMLALDLHERGHLAHDTVVATVMSNLGFVQAMRRAGITVHQTAVGDRYVLEAMRDGGFTLGGEQSGHIIMNEHATTGDGILTALHVLQRMARTGSSLRELASVVTRLPQVLVNVPGRRPDPHRRPRGRGRGRRSSRTSSATPAGSCCVPPAPSRWSA